MDITIRKAVSSDAEIIAHCNALMAQETEHLALNKERLLVGVQGLFEKPEYGFYLVAETHNRIVGQLMITYEWSDWRNGVFWWIQSVYVPAEFRSLGIFRKLYDYVSLLAKENGTVCGLRLYVEKENERASNVYEKLGMHRTQYDLYEVDFILQRNHDSESRKRS